MGKVVCTEVRVSVVLVLYCSHVVDSALSRSALGTLAPLYELPLAHPFLPEALPLTIGAYVGLVLDSHGLLQLSYVEPTRSGIVFSLAVYSSPHLALVSNLCIDVIPACNSR